MAESPQDDLCASPTVAPPADVIQDAVIEVIQNLVSELRLHHTHAHRITLDSSLERDLALDSLARVELFERLERAFGVRLSEHLLMSAEAPSDIVRAIQLAGAATTPVRHHSILRQDDASEELLNESVTVPFESRTLVEMLDWHARTHPQRLHLTLYGDEDVPEEITYGDLYDRAKAVATGLRQRDLQPRQTVALMLPTGRAFFDSFFGVLLAGAVPVPIYPPMRPSQIEEHMRRQVSILSNAQAVMMITVPEARTLGRLLRPQVETLRHVVTVDEVTASTPDTVWPVLKEDDLAFLQYTSGSTGNPKGVMLTHANLMANLRAMMQAGNVSSQDVFVSWLPLYHDMGLIGAWLGSLYYAFHLVLMSPLSFLARPVRWLHAIHQHRGTISGGPNFAYELCLRRIQDSDIDGCDLSSWRVAFNGAEPVSPETMQGFIERFADYGFQADAMTPVYGLAEGSLGLAFPPFGRGPRIDQIDRDSFSRSGKAVPVASDEPDVLRFVSCGFPLPGHQIRIVDAAGYELPERQEGQLEFCGPSSTSGYFRNPDDTRRLFRGDWVISGDRAYIAEGEVFITGREKDVIIRAGRNIYPHELEEAVGNISGVRKGCVVAFGSTDPVSGTERLVVIAETRETDDARHAALRSQIDAVVVELLGTTAEHVILAPPQTVLKTSSGKIRRSASRERYERGEIGGTANPVWRQVLRLTVTGISPQLKRLSNSIFNVGYAVYVWGLFASIVSLVWLLLLVNTKRSAGQRLARKFTRFALRLAGIQWHVTGLEHLQTRVPSVLVCNHASYLDAIVLTAVLPDGLSYIAKRELENWPLVGGLLTRLGTKFVERLDAQQGVEDTALVLETVKEGASVVFFPEGTFGREPGLRPFRMGAFMVAAQAGAVVVPVAMRGTRSILRAGQWMPRRGAVRLRIEPPIQPQGTDWSAAVALRDAAHRVILQYCGEPALEAPAERSPLTPDP